MNPTKPTWTFVAKSAFLLVFAISYQQWPLYSSNQNTYFLHGLAESGAGFLKQDWLAQTTDPFPAFTALVTLTIRFLGEKAFYFEYMALLAIYAYSLIGIACQVRGVGNSAPKQLSFVALLSILHSGLLLRLLTMVPGLDHVAPIAGPTGPFTSGVAGQYILGSYLQPSTFGVFVLFSIYWFLRDRPVIAVASLAVAATFHSAYLLAAAVLTCTYLAILLRERSYRKALVAGMTAIVVVTPLLIHLYSAFRPTNVDTLDRAETILMDRLSHHAVVANWFGASAVVKIALVAFAVFLARGTRLFPVLLVPLVAAVALTALQVATSNKSLALLFPWRMSVFLVPIATMVILAKIVSRCSQMFREPRPWAARTGRVAITAVMIVIGWVGVRHTINLIRAPRVGRTPAAEFVASTCRPGDVYLIPPDMEAFRLAAEAPIFVDHKSHPYKDAEVIEWFDRTVIASNLCAPRTGTPCTALEEAVERHEITHVIIKSGQAVPDCDILDESYRDSECAVFKVRRR